MVARPELGHVLIALVVMAVACPAMWAMRIRFYAWHAAAGTSIFFYAREVTEAERAWKPILGDPAAFFLTLWPGYWTAGGARLSEWLLPTFAVIVVACLLPVERRRRG